MDCTFTDQSLKELIEDHEWSDVLSILKSDKGQNQARQNNDQRSRDNNDTYADNDSEIVEKEQQGRLPIHIACIDGAPLAVIQALLDIFPNGASTKDSNGQLPLHLVCSSGCSNRAAEEIYDVVQALVQTYPEGVKSKDLDGQLPLHCACLEESPHEVIKLLLDIYPEGTTISDNDGNLPLHWVVFRSEEQEGIPSSLIDLVERIISQFPYATQIKNHSGSLPIHRALVNINHSSFEVIKLLIDRNPETSKASDANGNLPIHLVCKQKPQPIALDGTQKVEQVLPFTASSVYGTKDDNRSDKEHCKGTTMAFAGDLSPSLRIVKLLLDAFPEGTKEGNNFGELPLHCACVEKVPLNIVESILTSHPDAVKVPNIQNNGNLPLHLACIYDAPFEVVKTLLKLYPKASSVLNDDGYLPIHCSCQNSNSSFEVVKALIETNVGGAVNENSYGISQTQGPLLGVKDTREGKLPLHYACMLGAAPKVVKILVDSYREGASIQDDNKGQLPLHLAYQSEASNEVINMLMTAYPDAVNISDNNGKLPTDYIISDYSCYVGNHTESSSSLTIGCYYNHNDDHDTQQATVDKDTSNSITNNIMISFDHVVTFREEKKIGTKSWEKMQQIEDSMLNASYESLSNDDLSTASMNEKAAARTLKKGLPSQHAKRKKSVSFAL